MVHVGDPAAVVLVAVFSQALDLVLEFLQTWRERGEKAEARIRPWSHLDINDYSTVQICL